MRFGSAPTDGLDLRGSELATTSWVDRWSPTDTPHDRDRLGGQASGLVTPEEGDSSVVVDFCS